MAAEVLLTALGLFAVLLAWKGRGTLHERLYPGLYRRVDFPEDHFPADDGARFRDKTRRGYEKMKRASLIICGITRNDGETLPLTIRRIEKTGSLFGDYRVVVFENDSTDQTPTLLRQWEAQNARVTILSESLRNLPVLSAGRFQILAHCRNRYLNFVNDSRDLDGFEYIMVVDMDLRGGWSLDGLASSFAETGWDAMAANAIGYHNLRRTYYDKLALKPQSLLRNNLFLRLFGEGWQFRRNGPLVPVQSAFGGLCLYRPGCPPVPALLREFRGPGNLRASRPQCRWNLAFLPESRPDHGDGIPGSQGLHRKTRLAKRFVPVAAQLVKRFP